MKKGQILLSKGKTKKGKTPMVTHKGKGSRSTFKALMSKPIKAVTPNGSSDPPRTEGRKAEARALRIAKNKRVAIEGRI